MAVTEKKTYICKFCKVEVISKTDFRPIMLKQHKPFCRRAYLNWR